jgi:hypothetical protein
MPPDGRPFLRPDVAVALAFWRSRIRLPGRKAEEVVPTLGAHFTFYAYLLDEATGRRGRGWLIVGIVTLRARMSLVTA